MEKVDKVYYIFYLVVVCKEVSIIKVCVVYDVFVKVGMGGIFLNDCLYVGLLFNFLLFDILLRFREKRVVLVGDIEKVFFNIEVDKRDRDCFRFLWCDDVYKFDSKIVVYCFCCVVFGLNVLLFLLNVMLRYYVLKYKDEDFEFVRKMFEGFYVDDLVMGEKNLNVVFYLYEMLK